MNTPGLYEFLWYLIGLVTLPILFLYMVWLDKIDNYSEFYPAKKSKRRKKNG